MEKSNMISYFEKSANIAPPASRTSHSAPSI